MAINTFNEYVTETEDSIDRLNDARRKLYARCKKVYQYIQSAIDSADTDLDKYGDIDYTKYGHSYSVEYPDNPEKYDWFDDLTPKESNHAYKLFEDAFDLSNDIESVLDIMQQVIRRLEICESDLFWTESEVQ